MWGVLIVGILAVLVLVTASVINFALSGKQKTESDKNSLMAAGALAAIGIGFVILLVAWVMMSEKKMKDLKLAAMSHPAAGGESGGAPTNLQKSTTGGEGAGGAGGAVQQALQFSRENPELTRELLKMITE